MFFNKRRAARRIFLTTVTTLILSTTVGGLVIGALRGTTQTTAQTNPQNSTQKFSRAAGAALQVDDQSPKKGLDRQELAEEARAWHEANRQSLDADYKGLRSLTQASVQPDQNNEIAVVTGDSNMITAPRNFDLNLRATSFMPANGSYVVSTVSSLFDNNLGEKRDLATGVNPIEGTEPGDDAFVVEDLGFDFPFYGASYRTMAISSNGNLVFSPNGFDNETSQLGAVSSTPTLSEFQNGLPRIAPFWHDLDARPGSLTNPAAGIYVRKSSDRVMVTWNYIKDYPNTSADNGLHRFQVTLYVTTGRITITVDGAVLTSQSLVGVSPANRATTKLVDLSTQRGATQYGVEPIAEFFSTTTKVDYISAVKKFYDLGRDDFDFVFFMTDFPYSIGSGDEFAFYDALRNTDQGIGLQVTNPETYEAYGSNRLEGVLNLNSIVDAYPSLPTTRFLGSNHGLGIMAHELGHRWLSYIKYLGDEQLLRGRQLAHWNFFLDTRSTLSVEGVERSSVMEGNLWEEREDGRFETKGLVDGYSPLDQYLMGFRSAQDVGKLSIISNPSGSIQTRVSSPQPNVIVSGNRTSLSIGGVIDGNANGPRSPQLKKNFRAAVVLLVKPGTTPATGTLDKIKRYRLAFESYFRQATRVELNVPPYVNEATIDTAYDPQSRNRAISVVSALSYNPPIAPGALAAIFGEGLPIDSLEVKVNGALANVYYASATQINFQVPRSTTATTSSLSVGSATALIEVYKAGKLFSAGAAQIAPSAPAISFEKDGTPNIVDTRTSGLQPFDAKQPNGLPTILSVYFSGLGADATDITANVAFDVEATLDGKKLQVGYAGRSPGFTGLNQMNVFLPTDVTPGDHVFYITRSKVSSQKVKIRIK